MKTENSFPEPMEGSIFYENAETYACLAFGPKAEGHTIVAFNNNRDVEDINSLSLSEYLYFMKVVFVVRKALMEVFLTDKVYIAYIDESRHVHIHLFPRRPGMPDDEKGFNLMCKPKGELKDLSKIPLLKSKVQELFE